MGDDNEHRTCRDQGWEIGIRYIESRGYSFSTRSLNPSHLLPSPVRGLIRPEAAAIKQDVT